jgi:uncharacterized protein
LSRNRTRPGNCCSAARASPETTRSFAPAQNAGYLQSTAKRNLIVQLRMALIEEHTMPQSNATVQTQHGSAYISRLCKHWSHRFAVSLTDEEGHIDFGGGQHCVLQALPDGIRMEIRAPDPQTLKSLEGVVVDHLARMANHDKPSAAVWVRS